MSQAEPDGNTSTSGLKSTPKYQRPLWCFTVWPNDDEEPTPSQLSQHLRGYCKAWCFQMEKCPTTGKIHYQGWMSLKHKEYFGTVQSFLPKSHIEPMRDIWKSKKYCTKEETKIGGPWDENSVFITTIDKNRFYAWQKTCYQILTEKKPNDRTIHWIYDSKGNKGKTAFCKYMIVHHGAYVFGNAGSKDIAYAIPEVPKIILFNLSRSSETRFNYNALEAIKDGVIFSAKYESMTKVFNPPHVMVFANWEPEYDQLSMDRWSIMNIDCLED